MKGWGPSWFPLVTKAEFMYRMGAASELFTLLDDRITDLEQALQDAGIPIPKGYAEGVRKARRAESEKILGLGKERGNGQEDTRTQREG